MRKEQYSVRSAYIEFEFDGQRLRGKRQKSMMYWFSKNAAVLLRVLHLDNLYLHVDIDDHDVYRYTCRYR